MVRINGLACPAAAVSTSRSLRVVRTFLSNVLSISSCHPESGTSTRRSRARMTLRFTSRTGWQTIGDLKNPTTAKKHRGACAKQGRDCKHCSKFGASGLHICCSNAAHPRNASLRAPQCGCQRCGASPPRGCQHCGASPPQPRPRQERTTTAKTRGSSSSARRGTSRTTATPGTRWP